jgi:hypothetical protein
MLLDAAKLNPQEPLTTAFIVTSCLPCVLASTPAIRVPSSEYKEPPMTGDSLKIRLADKPLRPP